MERIIKERFDEETKYIGTEKACACCNEFPVSEDEALAAEMLCDRCARENQYEIIGYRKGE